MPIARLALAAALAAASLPAAALAAKKPRPYPTNACVAAKLEAAADHCAAVLKAWGGPDASRRDAAVAKAAAKLGKAWSGAETRSSKAGVDCAATTIDAPALHARVGSAAGALLRLVRTGLEPASRTDARCVAAIATAAGARCRAALRAEGGWIGTVERRPERTRADAAVARARTKFEKAWARATRRCAPAATATDVGGRVDALAADVVHRTTVSPQVSADAFTTISPTGSVRYRDRELTATCIKGTPYRFFAKRGTVNKLVVYYQGGGACWDGLTCAIPTCDPDVTPDDSPEGAGGFFDLSNPDNPFRDWNIVFTSYCSCDIHFGDAAQSYGGGIEHRGHQNARVVEKWAREHFVNPEVVFVTGTSAGAYGAWFNAPLLHEVWPAAQFHVLADAGNGVITQEFLDQYFPNWNFAANLPPSIPELQDVLENGSGIPGYSEAVAQRFPKTAWAHYSTAYDGSEGGQSGFYNIMLNGNSPIAALGWWNASCRYNAKMREQVNATAAAVPSNYRYYIGTGSRHGMWYWPGVYDDTTGGVPTLAAWVSAMLASGGGSGAPGWTNVECTGCGLLLPGDPRPAPLEPPFTPVNGDVVIQCGP